MREPEQPAAIRPEVSDSFAETSRERRSQNGSDQRSAVTDRAALDDEELIPKSYYREIAFGTIVDAQYGRALVGIGQRDPVTGKIHFDPHSKAQLLLRALKEQR